MLGLNLGWIYAHLIGDYLIQNDWMALNKKKSHLICLVHVSTYMIPFLLTPLSPIQLLLIAIQHYVLDRWYFVKWFCLKTKKFQQEINSFWGHIIVDNVLHIIWMMLVVNYCTW
jgi:hypothetical protein